jgi:glycosyltransferase involved in cell wall biosynthesis
VELAQPSPEGVMSKKTAECSEPGTPAFRSNPEKLFVVIAAFNEERVIGKVLSELTPVCNQVVVVDDGSADGTSEAALAAGATVITHPVNLGQGASLQTGIRYAVNRGADFVVTFDADGQHRVSDIDVLLRRQQETAADIVLGSRFLGTTVGMTWQKRLLLKAAIQFTRLTARLALTDAHNGFRLLTRRAAQQLRIRQNRMAHASEIVEEIRRHRWKYVEAPVTVIYSDYSRAKGQRMSNSINVVIDMFTEGFVK